MSHHARRLTGLLLATAVAVLAAPTTAQAEFGPVSQSRIVGGTPASPGEYPYQALLEISYANGTGGRCGGSLIAARFVLTAAHCMSSNGSPADAIAVSLGATDVTTPPRNFFAADLRVHPSYNGDPGGGHDAAIILLDKAAEFEQLRLLRPGDGAKWAGGVMATVIGWGATDDGQPASNQLLEVQVPMYSDASCAADFGAVGAGSLFIPETMVCAGGKDRKDSCQGDSGGPLLVPDGKRLALGGVVSFGIGPEGDQCASGYPGVYSRVGADPLNAWVRSLVPQVEIDAIPAQPEPGQQVSLSAAGANPFGPYSTYEWDLDNDGAFDDATGPSAGVTTPRGVTTVAVRATRAAADPAQRDQETRRIDLDARFRSPVSFPAAAVTVTEGQPVTVTVDKSGGGIGAVTATPAPGTAAIGVDVTAAPFPLTFAEGQGQQTFTFATVDDKAVEPAETFTVDLGGHSGELVPGANGRLTVTIADNDVKPRIKGLTKAAKRKRGKVALKYRLSAPATVTLGITDSRGKVVLAALRKKHAKAGTFTTRIKLKKAAARLLRKKRVVTGRVVYAIFEGDDLLDSQVFRFKLRR